MRGFRGLTVQRHLMAGTAAIVLTAAASPAMAQTRTFDVPAQPAARGIPAFAKQAGVQILASGSAVGTKRTNRVRGNYTVEEALRLLLRGTGLTASPAGPTGIITIRASAPAISQAAQGVPATADASPSVGEGQAEGSTDSVQGTEDIVVTGSNIRGVVPASSPLQQFDRKAIAQTGLSTTEQFIESLPQNFSGGLSEVSLMAGGNDSNIGSATGVNLRGLGSDSTLVLLDGRRLAAGSFGNAVDISMIPLSVIERIDVVTDGASAIYGSDAIAGVVNFTTRRNYTGIETMLQGGTVTDGSHRQVEASILAGKSFDRGNIMAVYDYQDRTSLRAQDRDSTGTAPRPFDLIPARSLHSFFGKGDYEPIDNLLLNAQLFYTRRTAVQNNLFGGVAPSRVDQRIDLLTYGAGLNYKFAPSWNLDVQALSSHSDTHRLTTTGGVKGGPQKVGSNVRSLDANLNGTLFALPGGRARLAIGGQYRKESYGFSIDRTSSGLGVLSGRPGREILSLFGEVFLPLVSPENGAPGLERLELTAAGRYEHYSDFGSTTNPKVGIAWSPLKGVNLRSSWGRSFRAPLLDELYNVDRNQFVPIPGSFFTPPADGSPAPTTLLLLGSNPGLKPERSTTWTAGIDVRSASPDAWQVSATYFDIRYRDRIVTPIADFFDAYALGDRFASLIDRSPSPAVIQGYAATPYFMDFFGVPLTDITAVVDSRLNNYSSTNVSGIDFSASIGTDIKSGRLSFQMSGTYLFKFRNEIEGSAQPVETIDTAFNPVDLRLRGSANWASGPLNLNVGVNYTDAYFDNRPTVNLPVKSFTTVDLSIAYDFGLSAKSGILRGTSVRLSAINAFDRAPPFVRTDSFSGVNFDGANASPVGRYISLQVRTKW